METDLSKQATNPCTCPTLYSTSVASPTIDWRYLEEFTSLAAMSTCSSSGMGSS